MPMGAPILIVEDNEANCELMRYLLQAYGHTVITSRDGATGLASAQRWRPALILCDIQMPGIDGTQLAWHIRQDRALDGIVLLAVTALAMVGDREVFMAAGSTDMSPSRSHRPLSCRKSRPSCLRRCAARAVTSATRCPPHRERRVIAPPFWWSMTGPRTCSWPGACSGARATSSALPLGCVRRWMI